MRVMKLTTFFRTGVMKLTTFADAEARLSARLQKANLDHDVRGIATSRESPKPKPIRGHDQMAMRVGDCSSARIERIVDHPGNILENLRTRVERLRISEDLLASNQRTAVGIADNLRNVVEHPAPQGIEESMSNKI